MAVRTVTSDPKPSSRSSGFHFFYYNKRTTNGSECLALLPDALRDLVHKGFIFDDAALRFDDQLRASVLALDFDQAPAASPALPADPEAGWGDHDHLAANDAADPALLTQLVAAPVIPNRGVRPATARKQAAASRAAEQNIEVDLLLLIEQVCSAYNYACKRIGVVEKPRAMEAQKLAVTALIPWLKSRGVALSDDDTKAMSL